MISDIDNWLNYLEKLDKKDQSKPIKKRKKNDQERTNNLNELKTSGIDNLYSTIEECKFKGRELTNFLSKLEFTFTTTRNMLRNEKKDDNDYFVLLLIALCSVMIEIIQDLKLESYENGRKFNVLKYLRQLRKELTGDERPRKVAKPDFGRMGGSRDVMFSLELPNLQRKKSDEQNKKDESDEEKPKKKKVKYTKKSKKDKEKSEDEYEDSSEAESTDDESNEDEKTNQGYVKDGFVVDDDEEYDFEEDMMQFDDQDYEDEENYDDYVVEEEEDEEDDDEDERNMEIIENSSNKQLNKKFLKEFNKFSEKYRANTDETIKYYCGLDNEIRVDFLNKIKELNNLDVNKEPMLFKIIKMNILKEQKNSIIAKYFSLRNSFADNGKLKAWMRNLMKIPFGKYKGVNLKNMKKKNVNKFIRNLKDKMDEAVWGHEEAKRNIIQMMGQKIRNPDSKGGVLGIWGPPGNGKTTLIKDGIAKAMDKPFVFISLGGAQDASFLEGHSYTYEGSICGRIVQGLMESKCMDPIIYFDELDKISKTAKGDEITNLLVHLIDPVQNSHFRDKYFDGIDFDLSKVTFIFSFNEPRNVNYILMDRIKAVQTKYLIPVQKLKIGKEFLLKQIFKEVGLEDNSVDISDDVLYYMVDNYTMEGGVRKLKKLLFSICRELNVRNLTHEKLNGKRVKFPFKLKQDHLKELLKEYYEVKDEKVPKTDNVGIVNGMWANSLGQGGILPIETMMYPSKALLETKATGSLEKVIKESIEVATSLAWSLISEEKKDYWMKRWKDRPEGFHIHCPDGGTPKDGPSAGAALTLAIYSLLMGLKVNREVSMTGEINLKGRVTKIGGLEEKLQGAKKAGVKLALIPVENEDDLVKIKERNQDLITDEFKVVSVGTFDDVLTFALA